MIQKQQSSKEQIENLIKTKNLIRFTFLGQNVSGRFVSPGDQIMADSSGNPQRTYEFHPEDTRSSILCVIPEQVINLIEI